MSTFFIQQFGCRATQADGAAIERQLLERGCTAASGTDEAEIVVINTCTVTSAADAQARDAIRKIHSRNPASKIIVTGCYAQRVPEEVAALPGVSLVVGNSHKPQIPALIAPLPSPNSAQSSFVPVYQLRAKNSAEGPQLYPERAEGNVAPQLAPILTGDVFAQTDVLVAPVLGGEGNHTRPTLKIQDGCNNRCSFCVIPFVRGKSRSLPPETVISEIRRLSGSGYKEIVLSGINLGAWGRDLSPRVDLLELLHRILDETSLERLRISSIEPLDVTQELIALFAATDRIAEHFHMPLQSGSDRILAAMHRWYRVEHYQRRVELIRECLPQAAIGADIIAGFPGESEDDHEATLSFIDSLPFTYLHVFSYSARPGTRAVSLSGHLPPSVIRRRARELRALGETKSSFFRRAQLGRILRVLTLHHTAGSGSEPWTPALSSNFIQVHVARSVPANEFLDVRVATSGDSFLHAESLESPLPVSAS